ncbi:MAG: hypothetical protein KGQ42_10170, partial [Alphaproteobacteria bacterium]|nr:hypothetical protein [Alphaproteobacteria bacterium]
KIRVSEVIAVPSGPDHIQNSKFVRRYIEGQIETLIKGPRDVSPLIKMTVELPLDARGKTEKIKKTEQIIFAQSVAGTPNVLQLIAPDAMIDWNAARESRVHGIIAESLGSHSPPRIEGVESAFSAPGNLPGERDTQIFLATDSRPVSLSITRKPDEDPQWSVALGELADVGVPPPAHDTLLWYELACNLPETIPDAKLADLDALSAGAVRADYALVRKGLGMCARARP